MEIIKKYFHLLLLWLSLTSTAPFIFYSWPGHPYKILTFICLSIMFFQIMIKCKRKILDIKILFIIIVQIVYFLFATLYHNDTSNINHCIQLVSVLIIISYINGFIGFKAFAKSYIFIILLMGIGGTITFFLHLLIGLDPIFSVQYSKSGTSFFMGLTTTNVYFNVSNIRIIRYSGFFDEPGAFALYSIFAILLNRIYFKNKTLELLLIFVTFFTLSLAFFIVMIFYFLFFYLNKSNFKYFIFILAFIAASFYYVTNNKNFASIGKLYEFTVDRFKGDNKGFKGNNRALSSEHDKKIFYQYPILGAGSKEVSIYGSNIYSVFAQNGIVGSLFYYSLLVYLLLIIIKLKIQNSLYYLKIFFLIILNFFHRPEMSSVFTILIFISLIIYVRDEVLNQQESVQVKELN